MTDLFEESFAERAAIMHHCGGLPEETAERMARADTAKHLHDCEVRDVVRRFKVEGKQAVTDYLDLVKKQRGEAAMEKLRTDALAEVKK